MAVKQYKIREEICFSSKKKDKSDTKDKINRYKLN